MPQPARATSLESLVHGGFFRDAGELIDQELRSNGPPEDGYRKLLFSIFFRQVARLDEAKEILGLADTGVTADVNGVFNYVQASLCQGRYTDALGMIERLEAGLEQDLRQTSDGPLAHLNAVRGSLENLTAARTGPLPSRFGRQPCYRIDNSDRQEISPSIVSDEAHPIQVREAVFCPHSHTWSDSQTHALVPQLLQPNHDFSGFFGAARPAIRAKPEHLQQQASTITGPTLYVPATLHFGHFLTQCAGFLHPLARTDTELTSDQPITCLLDGCLPEGFKRLIEWGATRPVVFRELSGQPVHATELIVSDSSWIEWHYCNRFHAQLFARAAAVHLHNGNCTHSSSRRVYFSRSRLTSGLRLSMNETDLERRLEAMGFTIIHPQDLDFGSLVSVLDSADVLAGPMGSAMHNLLFRSSPRPLTTINLAHFLPPYNFAMIESALGIENNYYLRACEEVRGADNGPNYLYFDIPRICESIEAIVAAH